MAPKYCHASVHDISSIAALLLWTRLEHLAVLVQAAVEFTVTFNLVLIACVVALVMLVTTLVHVWEVADVHLGQEETVV